MRRRGGARAPVRFTALGVRVEARSDDRETRTALARLLGAFEPSPARAPGDVVYSIARHESLWRLTRGGDVLRTAAAPLALLHWLVHDLNHSVIRRTTHITLHAGGVTHAGAILLPAKMESGKTTLTAGLVRAGLAYLSDEAVGIDPATGFAVPYPKPLSLDTGAQRFFPELSAESARFAGGFESQWQVPPTEFGSGEVGTPCPVRVVIFPRYEAGASTSVTPVGRAEALVELARNTFHFDMRPRESLDALAEIARVAPCYRLVTGDLAPAVAAVLEVARSHPLVMGKPAA